MIQTILIASDGSEGAQAAERYALALAKPLGARVRGITVIETPRVQSLRAASLGVAPPPLEAIEGFLKARADAVCQRLSERARTAGVDVEVESMAGTADVKEGLAPINQFHLHPVHHPGREHGAIKREGLGHV